jgi:hypothetical protein
MAASAPPPAVQDRWTFHKLCTALDYLKTPPVGRHGAKVKRSDILKEIFQAWRQDASSDAEVSGCLFKSAGHGLSCSLSLSDLEAVSQVDSAFPLVRLLLPALDQKRGSYNLKEV